MWRARCSVCMENLHLSDHLLSSNISGMAGDIQRWCVELARGSPTPERLVCWQPRGVDCLIINVDGSVQEVPSQGGFGGCFRSFSGQWLGGFFGHGDDVNILHLELLAIFHGLRLAWDRGARRVECHSDSVDAVKLVNSAPPTRHSFAALIWDIKDLLDRSWFAVVYHTLKEGNAYAYFLAKHGALQDVGLEVIEHPPEGLRFLLLADALGVSSVRP